MRAPAIFLAFCSFLLSGASAIAAANRWTATADLRHETVVEYRTDGSRFLQERGNQAVLGIAYQSSVGPGDLEVAIEHARPRLHYQGHSQNGLAIRTQTDYVNTRLATIYALPIFPGWRGRVGLEQEFRDRRIHATGNIAGLSENYRTRWEVLGLQWQNVSGSGKGSVSLDWMSSAAGRQKVWSSGGIDPVSFETGSAEGVRLSAEWPLSQSGDVTQLLVTLHVESLVIKRSHDVAWQRNGVTQGYLAQPATRRKQFGVGLSYVW